MHDVLSVAGIVVSETTSACSATFMATLTQIYANIRNVNTPILGQLVADAA